MENSSQGLVMLEPELAVVVAGTEHHQPALAAYAPHADGRARRVAVELEFTPTTRIEVLLDGWRAGELTAQASHLYSEYVDAILARGDRVGAVGLVGYGPGGLGMELQLPDLDQIRDEVAPPAPPRRRFRTPLLVGGGVVALLVVIGSIFGGGGDDSVPAVVAAVPPTTTTQPAATTAPEPTVTAEPTSAVRQPVATRPPAPRSAATRPTVTQPVAPQPIAPQPVAPQPIAPEPVAPEPIVIQPTESGPVDSQAEVDPGTVDPNLSGPPGSITADPVYFEDCDDVRAAGRAPIREGEPGYRTDLDGNDDGVGCEE